MQVKVIDDSKEDKAIWIAYYGLDPANGMKPSHMDASGNLVSNVPSTTPTDALAIKITGDALPFPMLSAARLYVSVGGPLMLTVDSAGNPQPPMPPDPSNPNYHLAWDFFEVTYIPLAGTDGLFNFNLSNVQSVNIPLAFHVEGLDPSTRKPVDYKRGWLPGGFGKFLTDLDANPDFTGLILPGTERVLAPGTAITAFEQKVVPSPLFDAGYLKAYIARVWAKFENVDLTFVGDPPPKSNTPVTWTGRVLNGQFTFTTTHSGLDPIVLSVPTTAALFENNFDFCVSGQGTPGSLQENYALQLFGTLCAAFNRSVMLTTETLGNASDCAWCKAVTKFYQDPTTNHYSAAIHANTVDGLAYAFQSDDHCDVSSFVSVVNPNLLTITLVY